MLRRLSLALMLLLACALPAQAAVSAVGTAAAQTTNITAATSMTFSHNSGAGGSNRLLICGISKRATSDATGITYNGVALTFLHEQALNANGVELWYLPNPVTGANNIVATMGASMNFITGCQTYQDVNLPAPFNTVAGTDGTGTSAPLTVTSAVGELVFSVLGRRDSTDVVTTDAGQAQLWNLAATDSSSEIGVGSQEAGAATSISATYTWSNSHIWSHAAVSLQSATQASSGSRRVVIID